ncbi:hypothetical protein MSMAP_3052 [Methanosarcina mazei SarPi]|uniref:Uncharacterized protein n=1 Tax=Methanosarcina mazei SarPi TaxID=1434115 RepID=A0A0E3RG41_METMZ|nr:hypothetical protein MSMAP_3052 [Methanosarcina mazei SarPi]
MHWYFLEVLPLFVLASVLIWIDRLTGLFALALKIMEYPTVRIGLPSQTAVFSSSASSGGTSGQQGSTECMTPAC